MNYRILGNIHKYSCQHYSWQQKVETIQRAILWITDKKNHISTQRISQLEENAVLIYTTTWMKLENIMLSEKGQIQKARYCMILFISDIQDRQIHQDRK